MVAAFWWVAIPPEVAGRSVYPAMAWRPAAGGAWPTHLRRRRGDARVSLARPHNCAVAAAISGRPPGFMTDEIHTDSMSPSRLSSTTTGYD